MQRPLHESVVVITGASSGIGRATALACARRGASVAVAARRAAPLEALARECEALGGRAVAVPTDVADAAAVEALARRAVEEFGRTDAWVNAAAVGAFARFEDTPPDVFRRVVDVILHGTANVARAALPRLRDNGGGTFVAVASTIGKAPIPLMSAYDAAKAGVFALAESVRMEVEDEGIHVCVVNPPPTDTPFYQHGANYTGKEARPAPPVYAPETVADAIVELLERPRREVSVGAASKLQQATLAVAPYLYEATAPLYIGAGLFEAGDPQAATEGAAFEPMPEGAGVDGGWGGKRAPLRKVAIAAVAVTALAATGALWWRARRDGDSDGGGGGGGGGGGEPKPSAAVVAAPEVAPVTPPPP